MLRLQKFLAMCGVSSRRNAEKMISDGRVTVNGHVVTAMGVQIDESVDEICVDGRHVVPEYENFLRHLSYSLNTLQVLWSICRRS